MLEGAFPGWQVAAFNRPRFDSVPGGVVIAGGVEPSGVSFRKKLDSTQIYRLLVRGTPGQALPGLRLHVDDRAYFWHPLDQGRADLVLPPARDLEVLLYADRPYSFTLQALTAEPCRTCITSQVLKDRIVAEAGVTGGDPPLVLARKLRDWTANTVVYGFDPDIVEATTYAVVTQPAWQTYTDAFAPARGAVSCAGMAAYYQKILALFGVPSLTVGIGYAGTQLTHVTTVVVTGWPDERRFYIFDPTFSGAYVENGQYVDVGDLLAGKKARFETDPMSRRVLVPRSQLPDFLSGNERAQGHAICDKQSAVPDTMECRGFVDNTAYNLLTMGPLMKKNGFPPDQEFIVGLMRHAVLALAPSDLDPKADEDFRRKLTTLGIPVKGS